jgi:hypothetical protein
MRRHGGAGVDEDAGADGEVLLELKVEEVGGRLVVVERVSSGRVRSLMGRP